MKRILSARQWHTLMLFVCCLTILAACASPATPLSNTETAPSDDISPTSASSLSEQTTLPDSTTLNTSTTTNISTGIEQTTPTTSASIIVVPMNNVPNKYYQVDKNKLKYIQKFSVNDMYEDEDGVLYVFDSVSGEYRGFSLDNVSPQAIKPDTTIPVEAFVTTADEIASHFIDVKVFERTYSPPKERSHYYNFIYQKRIAGYLTDERGIVMLNEDGSIGTVYFYNLGMFDNVQIPAIDEKKLDETCYALLNKELRCTEIRSRTLTMKDEKLYMVYECEVAKSLSETTIEYIEVLYVEL